MNRRWAVGGVGRSVRGVCGLCWQTALHCTALHCTALHCTAGRRGAHCWYRAPVDSARYDPMIPGGFFLCCTAPGGGPQGALRGPSGGPQGDLRTSGPQTLRPSDPGLRPLDSVPGAAAIRPRSVIRRSVIRWHSTHSWLNIAIFCRDIHLRS
jgi:hypothetical protein